MGGGLCKGGLFSEWVTSTCVSGLWVGCLWGVGCGCGKVKGERSVLPRRLRAVVISVILFLAKMTFLCCTKSGGNSG